MLALTNRARSRLIKVMSLNGSRGIYDTLLTALHLYIRNSERSHIALECVSVRLGNFKSALDFSSDDEARAMVLTLQTDKALLKITVNLKEGAILIDTTGPNGELTDSMAEFTKNIKDAFRPGGNVYLHFPLDNSPTAKEAIDEVINNVVGSGHNIVSASFQLSVMIPSIGILDK